MIDGWPIEVGPSAAGWVSLAALARNRFDLAEAYFEAAAAEEPGLDRRGQGAYLIGTLAFYFAAVMGHAALRDAAVPALDAEAFALQRQAGRDLRFRVTPGAATAHPIGQCVEQAFAALVPRIRQATRLGEAAQWRLIADGVAGGVLAAGQALGQAERARQLGGEIVRDKRYRFCNAETGYHLVDGRLFLRRGGCCRSFTADAGSLCPTCILRPPVQQIAEIRRRYLAE